jgi:hypothetical protein
MRLVAAVAELGSLAVTTMRLLAILIGPIVVWSLAGCGIADTPVEQRLADCTNSTIRFQMTVRERPPYQFVLGLPETAPRQFGFVGEIVVRQSTGTVARVPISSQDITGCNWLPGLSGYILTWGRTNRADKLERFLTRGQTYEVEVQFTEPPPPESSLWLSAMGKVGL